LKTFKRGIGGKTPKKGGEQPRQMPRSRGKGPDSLRGAKTRRHPVQRERGPRLKLLPKKKKPVCVRSQKGVQKTSRIVLLVETAGKITS